MKEVKGTRNHLLEQSFQVFFGSQHMKEMKIFIRDTDQRLCSRTSSPQPWLSWSTLYPQHLGWFWQILVEWSGGKSVSKCLELVRQRHDWGHWSTGFIGKCRSLERQVGGRPRMFWRLYQISLYSLGHGIYLRFLDWELLIRKNSSGWGLCKG